ncbi:hypothetical protein [Methylomagnum sp.]
MMPFKICLVAPRQPAAVEVYQKLVRLLAGDRESIETILVNPEEGRTSKRTVGQKAASSHGGSPLKKVTADVFVCWDAPTVGKVLRQHRERPVVYGVTLRDVRQGAVPIHPRIVGYLSDGGFPRAVLTEAGIPLKQQFSFSAWLGTGDTPPPRRAFSGGRHSVLLIADDPALIAATQGACELLWFRLELLPPSAAAQACPAEFYSRYDCVIAAGQAALRAAAAGVAVIVADGRGTAGRLSQDNLQRVLDAHAGPACFDSPIGAEVILSALSDGAGLGPTGLSEPLYQSHSESARARQLVGWLRQAVVASDPVPDDRGDAPRMLDISAPPPAAGHPESGDHGADLAVRGHDAHPASEVLVDVAEPETAAATLPRLPLNRRLRVSDEPDLTGLFGEGWHREESWGRWTGSREAVLHFMAEASEGGELELLLHLHAFLSPVSAFQRVVVSVNGHWLLCWKVDRQSKDAPFWLPLYPELSGEDGAWRIRLFLPDTDTPRAWGPGDCRQLGVGLAGLELRRAAATIGPPPAPCLPLDRRIPASTKDAPAGLFGEGWHRGEAWGRWSKSQMPVLRFRAEAEAVDQELLLHLCAFLPPGRLFQRVIVSVNGWPLLCWKVDREARKRLDRKAWDAPFRLPLPPDLRSHDGVWRVKFDLPDAELPTGWGQRDVRQLGLGLAALELRRADEFVKPSAPPPLPLDRRIPASAEQAPAGLFGEGWHRGEAWGRWSEGQAPVLRFRAEAGAVDQELLLHLCAFLPPGRLFQRVAVSVNGHPWLCWKVDREARLKFARKEWDAPFRLPLPPDLRSHDGVWRVKLELPDAEPPSQWGQKDGRQLGLALAGVELRHPAPFLKPPAPPRLPLGRYIHASDAETLAGLFGDGWSYGESWGRWTEKDEAVLRFETETVDDDLELLFHINTFLPPIRAFQRVIVVVNGYARLCWKVDRRVKEAPFRLPLPREWREANGRWRIVLRLPDADSPKAWGLGDRRQLGLGLSGLELRYTRPPKNNVSYTKTDQVYLDPHL